MREMFLRRYVTLVALACLAIAQGFSTPKLERAGAAPSVLSELTPGLYQTQAKGDIDFSQLIAADVIAVLAGPIPLQNKIIVAVHTLANSSDRSLYPSGPSPPVQF